MQFTRTILIGKTISRRNARTQMGETEITAKNVTFPNSAIHFKNHNVNY